MDKGWPFSAAKSSFHQLIRAIQGLAAVCKSQHMRRKIYNVFCFKSNIVPCLYQIRGKAVCSRNMNMFVGKCNECLHISHFPTNMFMEYTAFQTWGLPLKRKTQMNMVEYLQSRIIRGFQSNDSVTGEGGMLMAGKKECVGKLRTLSQAQLGTGFNLH